jgi:hypothetical protein
MHVGDRQGHPFLAGTAARYPTAFRKGFGISCRKPKPTNSFSELAAACQRGRYLDHFLSN